MANLDIYAFFSGLGFLDLAFEKTRGCKVVFSSEYNPEFARSYVYARRKMGIKASAPKVGSSEDFLAGSKARELAERIKQSKADGNKVVFIAGPPCPDFSVAGKNKGGTGDNGRLSKIYFDLVLKYKPDAFVFENVKGLYRTKKHREFFEAMKRRIHEDYGATADRLLNSLWFGAPQDRDRIILIGRKGLKSLTVDWDGAMTHKPEFLERCKWPQTAPFKMGSSMSEPKGLPIELTVQHWFERNDVKSHPNAADCFKPRQALTKFERIREGDDSRKSYKRLHRWRYSPTVAYGNNEVHLHPYLARRLTVAEALSLQGLPREFELPPDVTLSDKFKMIGNGVPYPMGLGIASYIKKLFAP